MIMSIRLGIRSDWRSAAIHFLLLSILFLTALLSTAFSKAQENGDPRTPARSLAASGPRTSPFEPPTQDSFVTDSGPGLDTACTFNDHPNHPLIIDVMIDRAVGPVDANGYLVDAASLVAQGIIPSSVFISMPAYPIDVNGIPLPERDEVAFNGETVEILTGDNKVWKSSSFSVPITKVKFPAPPAPGAAPVPRANRIVITVDTLSRMRWCRAVDWTALTIPIKPKLALTLEPVAGDSNPIRKNSSNDLIKEIYKQTADAGCNIKEDIGPIDEYPFSGSSVSGWDPGEAMIRTKIEPCPAGSLSNTPEVVLKWSIAGTSLQGTVMWSDLEGEAAIRMPSLVGEYNVKFEYTVDGEALPDPVTRKLYVTKSVPIVIAPRLSWYKLGTSWASGLNEETTILRNLLGGLYNYGQANWRYGYHFVSAIERCRWEDLAADPITCNYSDCHIFSQVFQNIAGTLGIAGFSSPVITKGAQGTGFVTTGSPSLDPAFPGNARPFAGGAYDRYAFGEHSLRKKGTKYYDATFNGIYSTETAFIAWNFKVAPLGIEGGEKYRPTVEGAKIFQLDDVKAYSTWDAFKYKVPEEKTLGASNSGASIMASASPKLSVTGKASFNPVDADSNGFFEVLVVDVEVNISTPGFYTLFGVLKKNGKTIAITPGYQRTDFTSDVVGDQPGIHTATLQFSGEAIRESGENGPYEVEVQGSGEGMEGTLLTPVYDHTQFGVRSGHIISASHSKTDADGDGRYDYLVVDVKATILNAGTYVLQGTLLSKDGNTIVNASETLTVGAGTQTLSLKFPGASILRSGQDGPFEAIIVLRDASGKRQSDIVLLIPPDEHTRFGGILDLTGAFNAQGIDNNGNGLYDLLNVSFGVDVRAAGTFLVRARLKNPGNPLTVYTDTQMNLSAGPQTLTVNFSGPEINSQGIDGPYVIEVSLRDPNTRKILDGVALGQQTAAYRHTDFDPLSRLSSVKLTGNSTDQGIDNNGNGLYDLLKVSVGVELTNSGSYVWSARLLDLKGTEIGFDSRSGILNTGTGTIDFFFNGPSIGKNGIAGPYYVRGLLMSGQTGANLVSSEVATTQAYNAEAFEGFVVPRKGDVDSDGDIDQVDLEAVLSARNTPASGPNDPRDLDGDGTITALDARQLRLLCSRPNCATQ
jgi:Dockerin type I domain